jgi:creatinine amidohydrolase
MLGQISAAHDGIGDALIVVPLGATEQHGPHLPLGTDTLIVDHVTKAAAERVTRFPVLVAPTLPVGYSVHHEAFGATCTMSADTFQRMLREVCESLLRTCTSRLFLVNGHGGNGELMHAVAKSVSLEARVLVGAGSYWGMARRNLVQLPRTPARVPGHAGEFETSLMLALRPDLVAELLPGNTGEPDLRDPDGFTVDGPTRRIGSTGRTDDPSRASASAGAALLEACVAGVARSLEEFWDECETESCSSGSGRRSAGE